MKQLYLVFLLFNSCANYVSSLHHQIDQEETRKSHLQQNRKDPYAIYREQGFKKTTQDRRPIINPLTKDHYPASNQAQAGGDILPAVKRDYRPTNQRLKAEDFTDNDSNGSLWASSQTSSSLYGPENTKKIGDIVIVDVLDNLRGQISTELKRAFPDEAPRKAPPGAPPGANAAAPASTAPTTDPASGDTELDAKVYDKISGVVVEEISKDYILIRGKKEILFRKEKRFIEVQALVPRRDVGDNDTVPSDRLLESRVYILR